MVQIIALMICTLSLEGRTALAEEEEPAASEMTVTTSAAPTETTIAVSTTSTVNTTASQTSTTVPSQSLEDVLTSDDMTYVQALQDQRTALQQQANELQKAREFYSDSLDGLLKQKESIEEQIALKQREIDINTQLSDSLTAQIHNTDEELIEAEQAMLLRRQTLLERFEALRQKLRALSKSGSLTTLQMLLSTDSYESFLINYKMVSRITQTDQDMLHSLETELADLQHQRDMLNLHQDQLETERKPYETAAQDLQSARAELLALHTEATAISDLLAANITYYRTQYVQLMNQQKILQNQIKDVVGKYDMTGVAAPTVMHWPSPECTIITSSYKARWGKWHYGLDIASWGDATGKPILAAADGTVVFAGSDDSGYGNYIIIDHGYDLFGKRILTMYAHCHELYVQEGDIVIGGQTTIAAVGDTGRSSGAHLHFEIRVDGAAVDPIAEGYLSTDGITIAD